MLAASIPKYVSSATEPSGPLSNDTAFSELNYRKYRSLSQDLLQVLESYSRDDERAFPAQDRHMKCSQLKLDFSHVFCDANGITES